MFAMPGARAQPSQNRLVKITVPQTAGTTNDLVARVLAPHFAEQTGRPCMVENRVGASGLIGMDSVAKAAPDGDTLLNNVSNTLTIPYFYKSVPFDVLADFEPIGVEGYGNHALVVHQSLPVANVQEFIAYAKARPGQLNYASPGLGTHHHLCMELMQSMTGIKLTHIPYKGSAGATTDVLAGQVQTMILPIQIAVANARTGKIRVLGGTRKERFALFPDVPAIAEQGLADFDVEPWFALWAPRGTPRDVVLRYNRLLNETLARDDVRQALAKQGLIPTPDTPEALARKARAEYEMWGKVVAAMNIRPE
ncbi:tripartite tricarboxylate transporter substrate binding protein [Pigmentiphaga soli]